MFFVVLSLVASYQGYQFTDSAMFCGQTCHVPMKPEFEAYEDSPHARVACAGCHVGPGATWFVRSKLSGTYQVYAVMFNKYPRPIETPIKELRPIRAACEQCHWPQKFYGAQLKVFPHYGYDEKNTPMRIADADQDRRRICRVRPRHRNPLAHEHRQRSMVRGY